MLKDIRFNSMRNLTEMIQVLYSRNSVANLLKVSLFQEPLYICSTSLSCTGHSHINDHQERLCAAVGWQNSMHVYRKILHSVHPCLPKVCMYAVYTHQLPVQDFEVIFAGTTLKVFTAEDKQFTSWSSFSRSLNESNIFIISYQKGTHFHHILSKGNTLPITIYYSYRG